MIQPITGSMSLASGLGTEGGAVVALEQRLALAAGGASQPQPAATETDPNPLTSAFLQALRQLPQTGDVRTDANAIAALLRRFTDPATGKPAFNTLQAQSSILQSAIKEAGPDDPMAEALQATMIGTNNLSFEMNKWMQDVIMSGGKTEDESEGW